MNGPSQIQESQRVEGPLILFDGICNLCNATVNFVLTHEADHKLRFAALQSDFAQAALARSNWQGSLPDSVILIEDGKVYTRSSAALRLTRHLRWPWRWLTLLTIIPPPLRDGVYHWIARNRYRWFGQAEHCRMPTKELQERFAG